MCLSNNSFFLLHTLTAISFAVLLNTPEKENGPLAHSLKACWLGHENLLQNAGLESFFLSSRRVMPFSRTASRACVRVFRGTSVHFHRRLFSVLAKG